MEIIVLILTTFFLPLAFGQSNEDNSTENDWSVETLGEKLFFIRRSLSSFNESKLFCKESFGMDILNSQSGRKDLGFLSWKVSNGHCNESFWIESGKDQCFSLVTDSNGSLLIPGTTIRCEVKPVPCNDQRMTVCQLKYGDDSWKEKVSSLNETLTALRIRVNQGNSTLPDSHGVNKGVMKEKSGFLSSSLFQIGIPVTLFALILSLFILVILALKRTGQNGGTRVETRMGETKIRRVNSNDPDYVSVFYNSTGTGTDGGEGCVQLNPNTSTWCEVNRKGTFKKNGLGRIKSIEANVYDEVGHQRDSNYD